MVVNYVRLMVHICVYSSSVRNYVVQYANTDVLHICTRYYNLNQNSQAVKKECGPQGEKRCEIQGGGQEMAVMVG